MRNIQFTGVDAEVIRRAAADAGLVITLDYLSFPGDRAELDRFLNALNDLDRKSVV